VTQAHPNIHAYRLTPQMRGVLERMERAGRPRLHTLTRAGAKCMRLVPTFWKCHAPS
jgi:hypothetical protein